MAPKVYGLSENEYALFKELMREHQSRTLNTRQRPRVDPDDFVNAPELYVVRNDDVILASTFGTGTGTANDFDSFVGTGKVEVYQLLELGTRVQPTATGLRETIHNLTGKEIPNNSLFPAGRDKYGKWLSLWPGVLSACPMLAGASSNGPLQTVKAGSLAASRNVNQEVYAPDNSWPPLFNFSWDSGGFWQHEIDLGGGVIYHDTFECQWTGFYLVTVSLIIASSHNINVHVMADVNTPLIEDTVSVTGGSVGGVFNYTGTGFAIISKGQPIAICVENPGPGDIQVAINNFTTVMLAPYNVLQGPTGIRNMFSGGVCVDNPTDCCPTDDILPVGTGTLGTGTGTNGTSGGGGGGLCGIMGTSRGHANNYGSASYVLTIPNVTVPAGHLLVVCGTASTGDGSGSILSFAATWGSTPMNHDVHSTPFGASDWLEVFSFHNTGATATHDVTVTFTGTNTGSQVCQGFAVTIEGLVNNALHSNLGAFGGSSPPVSGTFIPDAQCTYQLGYAWMGPYAHASEFTGWSLPLLSGGQDDTYNTGVGNVTLSEAYLIQAVASSYTEHLGVNGPSSDWFGGIVMGILEYT